MAALRGRRRLEDLPQPAQTEVRRLLDQIYKFRVALIIVTVFLGILMVFVAELTQWIGVVGSASWLAPYSCSCRHRHHNGAQVQAD